MRGSAILYNTPSSSTADDVGFEGDITLIRFKADGVTPDRLTVTPEPAGWGVLLQGIGLLGCRTKRR